jgi:hypothetical protein
VKQVRKLLGMTTDAAYDFMRTFLRLAARFDLLPADDLVDLAEKVDQPKRRKSRGSPRRMRRPRAQTSIDSRRARMRSTGHRRL